MCFRSMKQKTNANAGYFLLSRMATFIMSFILTLIRENTFTNSVMNSVAALGIFQRLPYELEGPIQKVFISNT